VPPQNAVHRQPWCHQTSPAAVSGLPKPDCQRRALVRLREAPDLHQYQVGIDGFPKAKPLFAKRRDGAWSREPTNDTAVAH
jgi:hypothetical protein